MRPFLENRAALVALAIGLPSSGVLLYLAARGVDAQGLGRALRSADPARISLAVAAIGVMYVLQAYRWRWIARRHAPAPSTLTFLGYVVGGLACNNLVPGRVGDLLRARWLARSTALGRSSALATVILDRAADVLALVMLLAVTARVAPRPGWLERLDVLAVAGFAGVVVLLLVARRHARRRGATVRRTRFGAALSDGLATIARTMNVRDVPIVAALSLGAWCAWAGSAWLVASALGIALSAPEIFFVAAVVNLGVAVPSSPGFVGTYQWLCVATLSLLAVGHTEAFAFSVLFHAVWYVPTTLAGLALAALHGRSVGLAALRPRPQTAPSA